MSEIKHFVYPLTGVEHYGEVIDSKGGFDVIECEICGFKHVIPIPTPEELDKLYKEEFYSAEKPNYLERHREGQKWWNLVYQDRYDIAESLERLFKKMGFEIILKEATFPIDLFLLMGDNYIGDELLGRACHEKRKHFELVLKKGKHNKLKRDVYRYFADLGIGRELTIYGRKPH